VFSTVLLVVVFAILQSPAFAKGDPNSPPPKTEPNAMKPKAVKKPPLAPEEIHQSAQETLERLNKEVNLTEDQKKAIRPIIENQIKEIQTVMAGESHPSEQKIKAIHQSYREQINKLLTPQQQEKLNELKKEAHGQMQQRIRERGRDHNQERIKELGEKLNLTNDQKKAVTTIIENEAKEIIGVMTSESLTLEQKMEKRKALNEATNEQINKILTPQQQEKFKEMKEGARQKAGERKLIRQGERRHRPGPTDSNS
jgi:Spy/CpxP family protein refolding chaperone